MPKNAKQYSIYVIELDKDVLSKKKYQGKNPDFKGERPCVYVGQTSLSPEERFKKHMSGEKSSKIVKNHGIRLKPRLFRSHNPMATRKKQKKWKLKRQED